MKTNRRDFFKKVGAGTLAASIPFASQAHALSSAPKAASEDQFLQIGDNLAIANTDSGKVRGYILNGVFTYLGIPYGADTAGKNRFMAPKKPEPWTDVKPTIWWGNTAPQIMDNRYANVHYSFADHWNYDDVSEDCLRLNVWTNGIADGKKRPVMVWLHGGGFTNGNGIEQDGYHGENIAKNGDIVFVSINHRLGPIGFTDLSGVGGDKYKDSGNVGMLDIIAALNWVKTNISNFGGDPGNVTIMGQSGGGAKVTCTMAMPASEGKVHKGVALSGSMLQANDKEYAQTLGRYVMEEAKLTPATLDQIQEISWREYLDIANRALVRMRKDNPQPGFRGGFGPVADGVHIPKGEFFSETSDHAANMPLMVCTTFHEWNPTRTNAELEKIDKAGVVEQLKGRFGEQSDAIYAAYAKDFPNASPADLWAMILSNRQGAINTSTAKASQSAPVYLAWFGWEPNLYDGRMKAFHCIDICFWYQNTDRMYTHTGGGARPRALSDKMSSALLAFMKTGNPNGGGLPNWPAYQVANGETMILDDTCQVKNKPDANGLAALIA
ncbi:MULTISPECIES: carboxylesterase family protein [unclassified Algoriphagus]|jgi:para-nitrobenzyl esterase|uniref:carboxylesterase/lipase family protein n=4 Tax=Algoriphagus TaxID=246875 RepID=UPI000C5AC12D|nr:MULTISPECIES: carboxylesterase family protein [unclassified Algoriphagus]MAL15579.1 carboxylesterase [Algoriphagus sp.]QYH40810.1 carboxylesterase/lipase family protein [Algoriphagus sp. NBT04N3]HAD51764.1 carboxylesterase [Algoriphagus sp.]HCB45316.1 carboxylesterase [Algoriphagus sp.]HCH45384.1 carboxylesterase [Algoriphagus sp.]|tara:strand:+ start:8916 stop:10574 length:1659 start_codon:yes stop_codon:yes gene_type:complete